MKQQHYDVNVIQSFLHIALIVFGITIMKLQNLNQTSIKYLQIFKSTKKNKKYKMQMQKQPNTQITIIVEDPEINTTGQQYVTYLVHGSDKNGPFSVRRRYNDFYLLREYLIDRWIGLYIPPIASKKATGNKEEKFVEQRKRFLHYFCVKIAQRPYLFYSEQFQLFLRNNVNLQKALKQLPAVNFKQKLQIYQTHFSKCGQKLNPAEILLMNQTDYDYLKKAEKKYENIRDEFKAIADTKKSYSNQFVHVFHNILPEYEDKFLLNHVGKDKQKLIISKQSVKTQLRDYQSLANDNPLDDYTEMISYELRESRAFIEAIESRKRAEDIKQKAQRKRVESKEELDKLQSGKSTLKSFFASGNKDQQIQKLEKEIQSLDQEIQSLNNLIPLMNVACHTEIKNYKTKRGKEYVTILKDVATKEIKQLSSYGHILKVPLQSFKD